MAQKKKKEPKIPIEELLPPPVLAYMLDITPKTLTRWADRGLISKSQNRKFWAQEVFVHGLESDGVVSSNNMEDDVSKEELKKARAIYERAKAKVAQAEVDIEKQKLLAESDVRGQLIHVLTIVKRELMILPRTLPAYLYGMEKKEIVDKMIDMLSKVNETVLNQTSVLEFKKKLRDLHKLLK